MSFAKINTINNTINQTVVKVCLFFGGGGGGGSTQVVTVSTDHPLVQILTTFHLQEVFMPKSKYIFCKDILVKWLCAVFYLHVCWYKFFFFFPS